jgi:hypothetical protein
MIDEAHKMPPAQKRQIRMTINNTKKNACYKMRAYRECLELLK